MLARAGHLAQAERWLTAVLQVDDDAGLRCLLGKVQAQQGKVDAARASLHTALQIDPAHAGARAALDGLARGLPGVHRRRLALGGVGLLVLVGGTLLLGRRRGDAVAPATEAAVAAAPTVVVVPQLPRSAADKSAAATDPLVAQLQGVDHYARLVVDLRRFAGVASLQSQAIGADAQGLQVRLTGTLPSAHLLDRVRTVVARHPQLRVDDAALAVDHRYRVRKGDSLTSIAGRLYGRAERWPVLWRANRHTIGAPRQLTPGSVLVVP